MTFGRLKMDVNYSIELLFVFHLEIFHGIREFLDGEIRLDLSRFTLEHFDSFLLRRMSRFVSFFLEDVVISCKHS